MPQIRDIQSNGIRMRMADSGGDGPAVVFIHGLGWDHHLWDTAFSRFTPDYRVIAGDTRGHGASDAPDGPYSIRQFADDWRGALDALGIRRACLVGFSQGGMIALQLALDEPQRFERMVLASTTSRTSPQARHNLDQRIAMIRSGEVHEAARLAVQSIFSPQFSAGHPDLVQRIIEARAVAAPGPLIAVMQAGVGFDVSAELARWTKPALVIAGSEDKLIPCTVTAQIAEQLPRATYAQIEGAGHMLPVEQPERFYTLIDGYLRETYLPTQARSAITEGAVQT